MRLDIIMQDALSCAKDFEIEALVKQKNPSLDKFYWIP
jgi:hypothetical protein